MYLLPQEIEVWYIIPAIRKELAKLLTQKYGMSYEKAGESLGISKAAISQYLSNKRANKITLEENAKAEIEKSAKRISENQKASVLEIERVLKFMKANKSSCHICKEYNKGVLNYCNSNPTY